MKKIALTIERSVHRFASLANLSSYGGVWIYREALPFGPPVIEELVSRLGLPMLYEFDDAIFLPSGKIVRDCVRNPAKTGRIAQLATSVVVSNQFLAGFARAYNRSVHVVPTVVDTDIFRPGPGGRATARTRIGWIGSHSTAKYLNLLDPVLVELRRRHDFEFLVVGACGRSPLAGTYIREKAWNLDEEVDDFRSLDIGVYPLEDSVWEQGKAGFKALQYMAVGAPCVASPVGVVDGIVRDGVNGFLATTPEEWVAKLDLLLTRKDLREKFAAAARSDVVTKYSTVRTAPQVVTMIKALLRDSNRGVGAA